MYPTSMDDLMAVADAGAIMPPKSAWFEPKLCDGLVTLAIDQAESRDARSVKGPACGIHRLCE